MVSSGNGKAEAVIGNDIDDVGEGLDIEAEYTSSEAIPSVAHASTGKSTCSFPIPTVARADAGIRLEGSDIRAAIEVDVPPKLHGNTFACLSQSEEEGPNVEVGPLLTPPANTDFSDTSPIIDTFKHIKRVDELDFTPVPLSRKKLKKLKKRSLANTQDPVIGGTAHLPNG